MEEHYKDRRIICVECQREFIFEIGAQKFYEKKGFPEPKRCPPCSKKRREFFNGRTI